MPPAATETFDDLASLLAFLDGNRDRITALVGEIGEVQKEFETCFVASQQRYEDLKAKLVAAVEATDWQRPAWLAARLQEKLPEVRDRQEKQVAKLRKELAQLETQRDDIEAQSEADLGKMRAQNPRLNEREEKLKAEQAGLQARLAKLEADLKQAGSGLGWLTRLGAIKRIRDEYEKVAVSLLRINERLTEVRQTWRDMEQAHDNTEDRLQTAWRLRVAEIARVKAELATLEGDFERACRAAAVDEILADLSAPQPSDLPDFDREANDMLVAHQQVRSYEEGIVQVAQVMGTMKGVAEGLARMRESVQSMKQEQDMHAELRDLRLDAPREVIAFHQLWPRLTPVVQDEKQAAARPGDFATKLRAAIGEGLAESSISRMFESLGAELKRAADKQW